MMTNERLADELRALGNLMLIAGDDEFKANRYLRLADTIEALETDVNMLLEEGRLTELQSVGQSTAEVIRQTLTTGSSVLRAALEARVPVTTLDLLAISGIGAKTARRLYAELGVDSLDALESALDSGRLATLKGMGAKTIESVRAGLVRVRRRNIERPLYEVIRLGEQIGEVLGTTPEVARIAHAGEARRGVETPRSIRLVVATGNIGRACVALNRLSLGDGSLTRDVHGEFGGGFPIHIHLAPLSDFGVTWLRNTADRAHLDALNERAAARSLPPLTDGEAWAGHTEERIYEHLGLPYITPELREGDLAIRRADAGTLPELVAFSGYKGDLHLHTTASDGRHSILEMAQAAYERGYRYIAVTDHSKSTVIANGLNEERLKRQIEDVRKANAQLDGRITILAGSEVDILRDGRLDFPDELLAQLDWVVASVHAHFTLSEAQQTERICRAMENPFVRVIGHPTGRLLGDRDAYPVSVPALIEQAAKTGVALELNASPERLDSNAEAVALAREASVPICLNTDAHRKESLAFVEYGLMIARRGWLEPRHVVNTWSLERVKAFRADARG
jgi:DNA polymerase (family 10)